jgi:putative protease
VTEEKREGDLYEIEEDRHGTYLFNSKDLCLIEHLEELAAAGVSSFKIEGRMKSEYYVASVVNAYRRKMNGEKGDFVKEVAKTANRKFTTGFVFGEKDKQNRECSHSTQTHEVVAICLGGDKVLQKNVFEAGDSLEILSPDKRNGEVFKVKDIVDEDGGKVTRANKATQVLFLKGLGLSEGDMLRKEGK